jgi:hypothetical protein
MEGNMDNQYNRNEFWSDFARRFEERMARRAERWQARAERRAARDERRYGHWAGWRHGMGAGMFGGPGGFGAPHDGPDPALKAQVDAMARTIRELTERVAVLEKLSVDPEAKLREEIEKLRREDADRDSAEGHGS